MSVAIDTWNIKTYSWSKKLDIHLFVDEINWKINIRLLQQNLFLEYQNMHLVKNLDINKYLLQ